MYETATLNRQAPQTSARDRSRVDQALDQLGQQLNLLRDTCQKLGQRLEPVMQPPVPATGESNGLGPKPVPTSIAGRIDECTTDVNTITDCVQQIHQRLEL
jgi:hypothetical protein